MRAVGLALAACACGPLPVPGGADAGAPPADAGTLGPELSCRAALMGALGDALPCEATAAFTRGSPNATTLTVRTTAGAPRPEVVFVLRFALEPEAGRTYGWTDDVLSADLSVNDPAGGNVFLASKAEPQDPASFAFRPGETTGRVVTPTGAQLRFVFGLEATLRPTPGSRAPNNARVTFSVTR
ncbi:MAG: hypothetical protein INH41_22320 [Myxococcaceae bacterium]|nr:hypothetical protein [Myxococcaceae bacterium]